MAFHNSKNRAPFSFAMTEVLGQGGEKWTDLLHGVHKLIIVPGFLHRGVSNRAWCCGNAAQCTQWPPTTPESFYGAMEPLQVLQLRSARAEAWRHLQPRHQRSGREGVGGICQKRGVKCWVESCFWHPAQPKTSPFFLLSRLATPS